MKSKVFLVMFPILFLKSAATDEINTKFVSYFIIELINNFMPHNKHIDIITESDPTENQKEIIRLVTSYNFRKFTHTLSNLKKIKKFKYFNYLSRSALLLINDVKMLRLFNVINKPKKNHHHIALLVYCENATLKDYMLKLLKTPLSLYENNLQYREYFIIDTGRVINLYTLTWFTRENCGRTQLLIVNSFDKMKSKWNTKIKRHEKFTNFYGCELVLAVFNTKFSPMGTFKIDDKGDAHFGGVAVDIFKLLSKIYNFTPSFQPYESGDQLPFSPNLTFLPVNNQIKMPNVMFHLTHPTDIETLNLESTSTVMENKVILVVTPGEYYTSYEKLLMPFDVTTWVLLIITLTSVVIVVKILNLMAMKFAKFVTNAGLRVPALMVVSTFFGFAQTSLPIKSSVRFIIMMLVLFCLIMRTAYQGVLFELITSQIRHPPPSTLTDLIEKHYSVYTDSHGQHLYYQKNIESDSKKW
jgi:hypothetical protein